MIQVWSKEKTYDCFGIHYCIPWSEDPYQSMIIKECDSTRTGIFWLTHSKQVWSYGTGLLGELGQCECTRDEAQDPVDIHKQHCSRVPPQRIPIYYGPEGSNRVLVDKIACGFYHTVALAADGKCYSWGNNASGQLGISRNYKWTGLPRCIETLVEHRISSIAAGENHTLFVSGDGYLLSCGDNSFGQLGMIGQQVVFTPQLVDNILENKIELVAAGMNHSAIVDVAGRVYTFGWGLYFQLGHEDTKNCVYPTLVEPLLGVGKMIPSGDFTGCCQIACGSWHTVALTITGDVYGFGWNEHGQLGPISEKSVSCPRAISTTPYFDSNGAEHEAIQIACGTRHTAILSRNGDVHIWGYKAPTENPLHFGERGRQCVEIACSGTQTVARLAEEILR